MATDVAERLMTAEEFMRRPELPNGMQEELIRGRIVTMAPPGGRHGYVSRLIDRYLGRFDDAHDLGWVLGETGFLLARDPDTVVQPDSAFVLYDVLPKGPLPEGAVPVAPTLAVEVLSDGVLDRDIVDKVDLYLAAGTQRVWVVRLPQRTVVVHRPNGDSHTYRSGDTLTSDDAGLPVPGFALPLDALFEP